MGGLSMVHLDDLQADEAALLPRSPESGAAPPALGSALQDERQLVPPSSAGGGSLCSGAGGGTMPPPTPPRGGFKARKPAKALNLTMPDENGRWAPVKYSASMANSPHGSCVAGSLAPSDGASCFGGALTPKSARSFGGRSRGMQSVREDDSESEVDE